MGGLLGDVRFAILLELAQDVLADEGTELGGVARKTSRQVLSMVERAKEEVSIGVTELANRVVRTHCGVSVLNPVLGGDGTGTKRDG